MTFRIFHGVTALGRGVDLGQGKLPARPNRKGRMAIFGAQTSVFGLCSLLCPKKHGQILLQCQAAVARLRCLLQWG